MSKLTKSWLNNKTLQEFDSSRLHIGEMMIITKHRHCGEVVLRCYKSVISLTKPSNTWTFETTSDCPKLIGRKLNPGESITLTQE